MSSAGRSRARPTCPRSACPPAPRADQTGCILSWQSFAEPADPSLILDVYDATTGFDGQPRTGTPMLCTNPLTGTADGDGAGRAPISAR